MDATLPPLGKSEERYATHLKSIGVDASDLSLASNGTVASISAPTKQRATKPNELSGGAPDLNLPRMTLGEGDQGELGLIKTIGMGGMGKVMLATQRPLLREVAVKLPRTENQAHINAELLREALVTGRLEHPNIVPVHLLGQSDEGAPFFVMKRIEGTPWRKLLDEPAALAALGERAADPLRFHLGVLLEVCDAVSFAHSRGVLHRDLKPDNVMLGQFGEVYVLDWGIAVTLKPDPHLNSARQSQGVCGTPAYMAPEMAGGDGALLSERTDVYLLGAVLHHILAGRGPHAGGGTLLATLTSAWESKPPQYASSVPDELANISRRAMARDSAERFASVQALRDAVEAFLRRRDSLALAAEGERRVAALEVSVAQAAARRANTEAQGEGARPSLPSGRGQERSGEMLNAALDAETLHAMFTESRFAFQQVRNVPGLEEVAKQGLRRALIAITRAEVAAENLAAARAHAAQLENPPPELAAELEALKTRLEARKARVAALEQLEQDADIDIGASARARVAFSVATVCSLAMLAIAVLLRVGLMEFGYREAVAGMSLFALGTLGVEVWLRAQVKLNAATKKLMLANRLALASFILFWSGAWAWNVSFPAAASLFMFHVSCMWGAASALFDKRGWPVAAAFFIGAIVSAFLPGLQFETFAGATFLGFGGLGFTWKKRSGASGTPAPTKAPSAN
ncbi:MAG: protein kinase [Archangium sp.]|nr:protein kinase [Archangium sp.]